MRSHRGFEFFGTSREHASALPRVDIDDAAILFARVVNGALQLSVPCGGNDGRMIQVIPATGADASVR